MILGFDEVYGWLNQFSHSNLSNADLLNFFQLNEPKLSYNEREDFLRELRKTAQNTPRPLQAAEIYLGISRYFFEKQDLRSAYAEILRATELFRPGTHQQGVTYWLLGMIEWELQENSHAYSHWFLARKTFQDCQFHRIQIGDVKGNLWYSERLEKINLDMASTVEEAEYWLNLFEPSKISDEANHIIGMLREKIQLRKYPEAYEISRWLSSLGRANLDPGETGEIWVKIGVAIYQMGDFRRAIDFLKKACASFTPFNHQWAVGRWMIGLIYSRIPEEKNNSLIFMSDAIQSFEELRESADFKREIQKRDWYQFRLSDMRKVLTTLY